jgi:hypothetical protein
MNRTVLTSFTILCLVSTVLLSRLVLEIKPAKATTGTIYIRVDGSVDPPTAPVSTVDNVTYILIGNITSDADGIVVERSNTIVDGKGFTLQGAMNGCR